MSLTRIALKFAAPLPHLENFDRYLFIGPHPDDIEIGAGATVSRLTSLGKQVSFLICTDGRFGDENTSLRDDALIRARREESIRSAAMLGVTDVRFLELSDGGFYTREELLTGIARVIGQVRNLACFAPYSGIMAGYGAESAQIKALALYMTARPNRFVATRGHVEKQLSAIFSCHLTQFPPASPAAASIRLYLKLRALDFGLRSLKGQAEGFRVLGPTQMHCLPEAGSR